MPGIESKICYAVGVLALNNLLITNWDNQNYTELDFYDLYEKMYYMKYGKQVPYEANYGRAEYEVPKMSLKRL